MKLTHLLLTATPLSMTFLAFMALVGCDSEPKSTAKISNRPLFVKEVPQNERFKTELAYMHSTGKLQPEERKLLEQRIRDTEKVFGVPRGLLWCILFQESRFDPLKNYERTRGARGLGQFTQAALNEINEGSDRYFANTQAYLRKIMQPEDFPLAFSTQPQTGARVLASSANIRPMQLAQTLVKSSYFHPGTAVAASAAYLNNRYHQLKRMLEREQIAYDPNVLWMYAAAAYNKGARAIYVLWSKQRVFGGNKGLSELLTDAKMSYNLLTHYELLDASLRDLWPSTTRNKYLTEMTRNLSEIHSCSTTEVNL